MKGQTLFQADLREYLQSTNIFNQVITDYAIRQLKFGFNEIEVIIKIKDSEVK